MIELLLAAERLLAAGELDRAERLFSQVADADPRNAIAVAGLARVTLTQGDRDGALEIARRALAIDPDDAAARDLVALLDRAGSRSSAPAAHPAGRSLLSRLLALLGRR